MICRKQRFWEGHKIEGALRAAESHNVQIKQENTLNTEKGKQSTAQLIRGMSDQPIVSLGISILMVQKILNYIIV